MQQSESITERQCENYINQKVIRKKVWTPANHKIFTFANMLPNMNLLKNENVQFCVNFLKTSQ